MSARSGTSWDSLSELRRRTPLVHNLINPVAMDLAANLLLAAGASPIMCQAAAEIDDVVARSDALSVNLGTPVANPDEILARAARKAVEHGRPWVFDPVACHLSDSRMQTARRLLRLQPTVIRGNGSEIMSLGSQSSARARGVDSLVDSSEALDAARDLAKATGAVIAVTGPVDYVTDGRDIRAVANGDLIMSKVTGVGCSLTCLVAAFCAVNDAPLHATLHALAAMGVAGELAVAEASGPGSFRVRLVDALYNLDETTLSVTERIE